MCALCANETSKERKMSLKLNYTEEQVIELKQRIKEHKKKPGSLMPTLHDAQEIFGCIPIEVQKIISKELGESIAMINGVVTFYSRFSIEPKGKHIIGVCLGTACYVRGSQLVLDEWCKQLKIKPGQTTEDGKFTLEATRCVGACGLAPVFVVDGKVFGKTTPDIARREIKKLFDEEGIK